MLMATNKTSPTAPAIAANPTVSSAPNAGDHVAGTRHGQDNKKRS